MTLDDLALELVHRDLVATVLPLGPDWLVHVQPAQDIADGNVRRGWVGKGDDLAAAVRDALNKYDERRTH